MNRIRDFIEDIAIYLGGTVIVLMMCVLYVVCKILGINMEDDF